MADRYFLKGWEWGMLFLRSPSCRSSPRLIFSRLHCRPFPCRGTGLMWQDLTDNDQLCHFVALSQRRPAESSFLFLHIAVQQGCAGWFQEGRKTAVLTLYRSDSKCRHWSFSGFLCGPVKTRGACQETKMQTERMRQMSDQILLMMCIKLSRGHRSES